MAIQVLPVVFKFKISNLQSFKVTMKGILLISFFVLGSCQTTEVDIQNQLSTAINKFSNQLYTQVAETKPKDDLIMSGMSAHTALALLSLGAGGQTLDEINTALYLPNSEFTKVAFKPAIMRLNNLQGVTLETANKIFVNKNYILNPDFKNAANETFSSEIDNVEFALGEEAAAIINSWVQKKTNDKIQNIVTPDLLNSATRLVLVNAIYFKGIWASKFEVGATNKTNFNSNSNQVFQVDMMNKLGSFNYADLPQWDAQALEIHYQKQEVSMVLILPNKIDGLSNLEKNVMNSDLKQSVFDTLYYHDVSVSIPKFKIETQMSLEKILQQLGMKSMFSPNSANLLGLLKSDEQLNVDFVIQKAFIEINEKGTEAAATTVIGIVESAGGPDLDDPIPKRFNADHPFLYFIKTKNGDILFMGRFGVSTENKIPEVVPTTMPIVVTSPKSKDRVLLTTALKRSPKPSRRRPRKYIYNI